jgi:hypothetical protein
MKKYYKLKILKRGRIFEIYINEIYAKEMPPDEITENYNIYYFDNKYLMHRFIKKYIKEFK